MIVMKIPLERECEGGRGWEYEYDAFFFCWYVYRDRLLGGYIISLRVMEFEGRKISRTLRIVLAT